MEKKDMPIGFFDSGIGGLSVMKEALKIMPNENYIYFGDSINAPYGVKSVEEVRDLTFKAVEFLLSKGIKGIAIACNTATSAAVAELRIMYPNLPLVGIEPAIKPAVELGENGNILIMATSMTIKEAKFNRLMDKYRDKANIIPVPCPGLVEFIEAGKFEGEEIEAYLNNRLNEYRTSNISAIVLGCTHYPFIKPILYKIFGNDISIIDGGSGTVKEFRRKLIKENLLNDNYQDGKIEIINSSNQDRLVKLSYKLLNI